MCPAHMLSAGADERQSTAPMLLMMVPREALVLVLVLVRAHWLAADRRRRRRRRGGDPRGGGLAPLLLACAEVSHGDVRGLLAAGVDPRRGTRSRACLRPATATRAAHCAGG